MKIHQIISISRPRFWIYEFGTFVFGAIAAFGPFLDLLSFPVIFFGFYFLIPANILIYGINDIFDYETDKLNPKKVAYEELLEPKDQKKVWYWIIATNIPFIIGAFWLPFPALISFIAFLFFASFYSAKPIRAKAIPFLDSLFSASHYIATGVFGYYLLGGNMFPITGVIAGIFWAIAMHAYSAVPDIQADKDAGLSTIATMLREKNTIILCLLLYGISGYLGYMKLGIGVGIYGIIYITLMLISLKKVRVNGENIFSLYRLFPYINLSAGAILTISLLLQHPLLGIL
jgi:4-hydroxybenzoate polyprenyltransferase